MLIIIVNSFCRDSYVRQDEQCEEVKFFMDFMDSILNSGAQDDTCIAGTFSPALSPQIPFLFAPEKRSNIGKSSVRINDEFGGITGDGFSTRSADLTE